jgi:23S rRNA (cytidine1920-2'-O)/16S rRNA (cytidine1409-2'-O)-methyltransferase
MTRSLRLDKALVELGLVRSRTQAQRFIKDGYVRMDGQLVTEVAELVQLPSDGVRIRVDENPENRYVSRGGLKLEAAIQFLLPHFNLATGPIALDIGISTGGFTDCLLAHGAAQVWGVDVGHGQLDPKIANDTRVIHFEGLNARNLLAELALRRVGTQEIPVFDIAVVDVSFISLKLVLPNTFLALRPGGILIALVKPQFELGAAALDKRGVVKDPILYEHLERTMRDFAATALESAAEVLAWLDSPITGGDGNREFLLILKKESYVASQNDQTK